MNAESWNLKEQSFDLSIIFHSKSRWMYNTIMPIVRANVKKIQIRVEQVKLKLLSSARENEKYPFLSINTSSASRVPTLHILAMELYRVNRYWFDENEEKEKATMVQLMNLPDGRTNDCKSVTIGIRYESELLSDPFYLHVRKLMNETAAALFQETLDQIIDELFWGNERDTNLLHQRCCESGLLSKKDILQSPYPTRINVMCVYDEKLCPIYWIRIGKDVEWVFSDPPLPTDQVQIIDEINWI